MSHLDIFFGMFEPRRVPEIRQSESSECGLACLAMVLGYHGHKTDIATLRAQVGGMPRGVDALGITRAAHELGLDTRAFRVEMEYVFRIPTPSILHWNLNHFVVLVKTTNNWVHIVDPVRGALRLSMEQVSNHFSGVVVELSPGGDFQKRDDRSHLRLRTLWSNSRGMLASFAHLLFLSVIVQGMLFVTPLFAKISIDEILPLNNIDMLQTLFLGFCLLTLFHIVCNFVRDYLVVHISSSINLQIKSNLVKHLFSLPPLYFYQRQLGDIMSRLGSSEKVEQFISNSPIAILVDSILGGFAIAILFFISPIFSFVILGATVSHLCMVLLMGPSFRRVNQELAISAARASSFVMETARTITTIKAADHEASRTSDWRGLQTRVTNQNAQMMHKYNLLYLSERLFFSFDLLFIVYLGVSNIIDGSLSIGSLFAALSYRTLFIGRAIALFNQMVDFSVLHAHLNRLSDIVFAHPEIDNETVSEWITLPEGEIVVRQLGFRYSRLDAPVLENVNFTIAPGDFVAITGPSGAGKTSLLKVLAGLLRPENGEIIVDGSRITSNRLPSYRQQIGLVLQDDNLLSGSIADNISMFADNVDFDRIAQCAQLACVADDIGRMPMRFQTLVGDLGSTLSGGQLQRLFLARALYRSPRILFLDEATSDLDVTMERQILENLRGLGITCVQTAHRPQTIDAADYVITVGQRGDVLSGGPVVNPPDLGSDVYD